MRDVLPDVIERGRFQEGPFVSPQGALYGGFRVRSPFSSAYLNIISSGVLEAWQHVSVSTAGRCPNWQEMQWVKEQFWADDECVIQFHPPKSDYVNCHPFTLHLWKSPTPIAMPPKDRV